MMTEEREQFEEWFADHSGQTIEWVKSQRETDKHYKIGPEIQRFWMAWQASRAAQPATPALKLPDPFSPHDAKMFCAAHGVTGAYELASQMANYAVDKVVRLNAPHTAPIEPICATGGAEWVKVSEELPEKSGIYWCFFGNEKCSAIQQRVMTFSAHHKEFNDYGVTHWMPRPAAPEA